ncbi:uncharacterized protein LOC108033438 [Drosophila biarmipes]|uniref:uncharacterized protein LOC108033438 n=1 Tax=Drosophila biarmipes TaxID=125945 RepID=UPI0007E62429|nr:uncharacterized protein LOC108033438 [Drosophila biarmipes]XP_050741307.1 uncharacterized protein LOC108033438 [Drosophila biarmipes]XP_050741308.1 uncharacterized protein LOC108033438 [Drosophila biarmipes]XP_050741309.1 uncharacterized protein LOC108033438 [Drosophila biarmipes]
MPKLIQGPSLEKNREENGGLSGQLAVTSTVKLNVNAQEFIPRFKREETSKDKAAVPLDEDEQKVKSNLTLPWKGFPKKAEKSTRSAQVVLLNDVDYMILPCVKRSKKPREQQLIVDVAKNTGPNGNAPTTSTKVTSNTDAVENRREQERKVALEALKLSEQRRLRGPFVPPTQENESSNRAQPVIHLSRSPIRFTPEERVKVDRLRIAKRERIERILREMTNEKQEQLKQQQMQQQKRIRYDDNVRKTPSSMDQESEKKVEGATVNKKRYIPTTKEWDEQCRAKYMAKLDAEKQTPDASPKPPLVNPNVVNITPSGVIRLGDFRATSTPRYCPPSELLEAEKRRGNLTHFRPLAHWTIRQSPLLPLKNLINQKGKIVERYSIEQLLELEPQPGELEKPALDEDLHNLGFLCD